MGGVNICANLGGNTGAGNCQVRMGRIKYILPTNGKTFSAADLASAAAFKTALQASMLLGSDNVNKVYAFPEMKDVTDNTGEPQTGTLADGYEEVLNEALAKYLLKGIPGVCVQQAMASFNGFLGKFYVVDDQNILWYKLNDDQTGKGWTCGYLYTNPPKFKGSGDVQTANTRLTFGNIDEFKYSVGALKLDFSISNLLNVQDVTLFDKETENVSGSLNNVFIVGAKILCDGTDLYASYGAALTPAARWRAYKADGTALTIQTVTINAGLSAWNVTMAVADYNAMASGTVFYIDLVAPNVLAAAGVAGIEGKKLRFVKF